MHAQGGDGRYRIQERLGAGGMGVVYRAIDEERGGEVALKVLKESDPQALFRFKQEFRSLADVTHPNLVPLYELVSTGDQWFFTMPVVAGVDFLAWVRGGAATPPRPETPATAPERPRAPPRNTGETLATAEASATPEEPSSGGSPSARRKGEPPLADAAQFDRLRRGLAQLVDAVAAIHAHGQLHRDLKPSNVLVTQEGHLYVMDFGVATALGRGGRSDDTRSVVGTPAYMAPEQALAQPLTPAADWYAVGVMLYEALTGRRPYQGDVHAIIRQKRSRSPVTVEVDAPAAPADLVELCRRLLAHEPAARPTGAELAMALRSGGVLAPRPVPTPDGVFIGREPELRALDEAFRQVQGGGGRTVLVHGTSGMGKSELVAHFLGRLENRDEVVILRGRCYERENVPYKAVDSLIDALATHLVAMPEADAASILPADVQVLARSFPVLRRVGAVLARDVAPTEEEDPLEQRRRAFLALRELLTMLATRRPLVLYLDDLQWGDTDSASLLVEVLRLPSPPPALVVCTYRSEDAARSAFLRAFLPGQADAVTVQVAALSPERTLALARSLLAALAGVGQSHAEAVAAESGGNPLFVAELARYVWERVQAGEELSLDGQVRLEEVLLRRFEKLPPAARRLLEVVAVIGVPVEQALARGAASLEPGDQTSLQILRGARLVRTRGAREEDEVEAYHDRIRETAADTLTVAQLKDVHRRIALSGSATGKLDAELVGISYEAAGLPEESASCYVRAAERAGQALAFDRAADLYTRALGVKKWAGPERLGLEVRLGETLANAGHLRRAADAFLSAARGASAGDALALRRRAAMHLLHSGHLDAGSTVLEEALVAAGIPTRHSVAGLLVRRARVRMKRLRFTLRDAGAIGPAEEHRLDTCHAGATGFGMIDVLRGADFQARHLLLSLDAGHPTHLARSLALEAVYSAVGGAWAHAERAAAESDRLAAERGDPLLELWALTARAMMHYVAGRLPEARQVLEAVLAGPARRVTGASFERAVIELYEVWTLYYLGDYRRLSQVVPRAIDRAQERGDLYTVTNLSTGPWGLPAVHLVADRPDAAAAVGRDAMANWSTAGVHFQHYWEMAGRGQTHLYAGEPEAALALVADRLRMLKAGFLYQVEIIRTETAHLRARAHIMAARGPDDPHIRAALKDAALIRRATIAWARPVAALARAGASRIRGDLERARGELGAAASGFDALGMKGYANAARRQLGRLLDTDEGRGMLEAADDWFRGKGVVRPDRFADTLAPIG